MIRSMALLAALALVGCAQPTGVALVTPPAPPPPVTKFVQAGRWTVNRIAAPGGYFCAATNDAGGPKLAVTQTAAGLVGLDTPEVTGQAQAGGTYAMQIRFDRRPSFILDSSLNAPGRLVTLPPAEGRARELARGLSSAKAVSIEVRPFGPLGTWDLAGSAAALDALDRCAKAG